MTCHQCCCISSRHSSLWELKLSGFCLSLSLSFRLWIPQVSSQPHRFFFSSHLEPVHPLVWGSGWWYLVRWCLSIFSSAFPDSDIHTLQLRGYAWWYLDMSVPSQSWLTYFVCNATDSNGMANVIISFLVLQCDTKHPSEHSHFSSFKKPLFTSSQGPCFCSINHHWPYHCFFRPSLDCNRHPLVTQHSWQWQFTPLFPCCWDSGFDVLFTSTCGMKIILIPEINLLQNLSVFISDMILSGFFLSLSKAEKVGW